MQIFFVDQAHSFSRLLSALIAKPVMQYDKSKLIEKSSSIIINRTFSEINFKPFFNYEIFPQNIMTFQTQWQLENRQMKSGDTILQQAFIPPTKLFSQKIIFGVRINEVIDSAIMKSFSYETLRGNVEKGISTFSVEPAGNNCTFKIHTYSKPGNILTQLLGPIFSVPYQTYCTKAALNNVKKQMENKS